jgi:hypothetical protein
VVSIHDSVTEFKIYLLDYTTACLQFMGLRRAAKYIYDKYGAIYEESEDG